MRHLSLALLLVGCTGQPSAPPATAPTDAPATTTAEAMANQDALVAEDAKAGVEDPALAELLAQHWDGTMLRNPLWATSLGDLRNIDSLADPSPEARKGWQAKQAAYLTQAKALDPRAISESDRLTLRLFVESLEHDVAAKVCEFHAWSVSPRSNPYADHSDMHENLKVDSAEKARAQLRRLEQLPAVLDASSNELTAGAERGLVANAASVQLVIEQLTRELDKSVEQLPMWKAVTSAALPDAEAAEFADSYRDVLSNQVRPAVTRYRDTLQQKILPKARGEGSEGLAALPLGSACYQALVHRYTTLPEATADERHQAGLDALRGIHGEFAVLGEKVLGTKDVPEIFAKLRNDEALFFKTEEEVEAKAKQALAKAEAAMPKWFGRLPKNKATVERIPAHEAPFTTIAYYKRPDAENGGRYFINTYAPATRPRHEAEVLAYHEAIPGHHLQIAIAQELPKLPAFRRYGGMTAFVEGWALYTERLSDEMGLYTADTDRLGMLSFDAWRAARLVVDTGIHHKGWSRQQAEAFLLENTPLAANNIRNEVDRYITTPGQALAYKTGQAEMWKLRRAAEKDLGDRFDIKAFHDVVLSAGAVSLPVLQERVQAWVAEQN
ncbi:MAG: DUF885 family protein [Myxococcota bacterium]